jgi:uncharacterized protein YjbK
MAGINHLYDDFYCPNAEETWHREAADLHQKIKETSSKRVRELYQLDLEEILTAHECQLPESGEYQIVFEEVQALKKDILQNGKNLYTIEFAMDDGPASHSIYFFDQKYYVVLSDYEFEDDLKDYSSFEEAFDNPLLNMAIEYTTSISSSVFSVEEIKKMVTFLDPAEKTILINGEPVRVKYEPPYPWE